MPSDKLPWSFQEKLKLLMGWQLLPLKVAGCTAVLCSISTNKYVVFIILPFVKFKKANLTKFHRQGMESNARFIEITLITHRRLEDAE